MTHFTQETTKTLSGASKCGRSLLMSSAVVLATALTASVAHANHPPISASADGDEVLTEQMGEPRTYGLAAYIEQAFIDGVLADTFDDEIAESAQHAANTAYAQKLFQPLWSTASAKKLLEANATYRDYKFDSGVTDDELSDIVDAHLYGTMEERAEADLKLSATWLIIASKVSGGLTDEGAMVRSTKSKPTRSELVVSLINAADQDPITELEKFASFSPQIDMLEKALKQYQDYSEAGGWLKIRDDDDFLEPGMDDPRVPALRMRLKAEGFDAPQSPFDLQLLERSFVPTVYDLQLEKQMKAFQAAHGLEQDGVLGPATLRALNESVESKIARIETSLEYWYARPNLGEQHVWTNIPSYRVEGWKDGERQIHMKTIVGKKRTPSVAFSDEIEYIVVNPKWYLPIGLFKRQKLRKLRKNPGYAAANNYVIYDRASGETLNPYNIDWKAKGVSRRIQMVQSPGPHNALGQLKIIFPNRHSIYLHDTPSDHLFERDVRALSSGCIRLERPVDMANWLTDHDAGISTNVFNSTLQSRERDRFYLDDHVKVHLTYLPAVVGPDGTTEFPADIYRKFNAPEMADGVYDDDIELEIDYDVPLLVVDTQDTDATDESATGPITQTRVALP